MTTDDYRYGQEAAEHHLRIIWRCPDCGWEREDYPGCNEFPVCKACGATCQEAGESYQ